MVFGVNIREVFGRFLADSRRILVVSKKPTMDEYKKMALIIAIGMVIIGVIGFIIQFIFAITGLGI